MARGPCCSRPACDLPTGCSPCSDGLLGHGPCLLLRRLRSLVAGVGLATFGPAAWSFAPALYRRLDACSAPASTTGAGAGRAGSTPAGRCACKRSRGGTALRGLGRTRRAARPCHRRWADPGGLGRGLGDVPRSQRRRDAVAPPTLQPPTVAEHAARAGLSQTGKGVSARAVSCSACCCACTASCPRRPQPSPLLLPATQQQLLPWPPPAGATCVAWVSGARPLGARAAPPRPGLTTLRVCRFTVCRAPKKTHKQKLIRIGTSHISPLIMKPNRVGQMQWESGQVGA